MRNFLDGKWLHLLIPMLLIALIGNLCVRIQTVQAQVNTLSPQVSTLQVENGALKDRLEASRKIETPESVKKLSTLYINKYFGKDAQKAIKIVTCESNLNNLVVHKNSNNTEDRGIFQINSVHALQFKQVTGMEYETGSLDFDANVKFAKWMFDGQGNFSAWVCSRL